MLTCFLTLVIMSSEAVCLAFTVCMKTNEHFVELHVKLLDMWGWQLFVILISPFPNIIL